MWDLVLVLSKVSKAFQKRDSTIGRINSEIEAAKDVIESYQNSDGPKLRMIMGKDTYEGHALSGNLSQFESARKKLTNALNTRLSARFEADEKLLEASSIADLANWPLKFRDEPDYGVDHVCSLVDEFQQQLQDQAVSIDEIHPEWIKLRKAVQERFGDPQKTSWPAINRVFKARYPCILALVDITLTLPACTAEPERGFSVMKNTKTDWRSSMGDKTLSDLMTIKMEAPPILPVIENQTGEVLVKAFDPVPAIELWLGKKNRRIKVVVQNEPLSLEREGAVGETVTEEVQQVGNENVDEGVQQQQLIDAIMDEEDECYYSDEDLVEGADDLRREEEKAYALLMSYGVTSASD